MASISELLSARAPRRLLALAALGACSVAAQASIVTYSASLGPELAGATGSGSVQVVYDPLAHTLTIEADWSGLSGLTTVAHIHCCTAAPDTGTAGVAVTPVTLPGFPAGVSSGSYLSPVIDLTAAASFNAAFISTSGGTAAAAEAALLTGFDDGRAYFNIHTGVFPGGEIRGFLQQVPEPGTFALLGLGLVGLAASRRCRQ